MGHDQHEFLCSFCNQPTGMRTFNIYPEPRKEPHHEQTIKFACTDCYERIITRGLECMTTKVDA